MDEYWTPMDKWKAWMIYQFKMNGTKSLFTSHYNKHWMQGGLILDFFGNQLAAIDKKIYIYIWILSL